MSPLESPKLFWTDRFPIRLTPARHSAPNPATESMNAPLFEILRDAAPWAWRQLRKYALLLLLPPLLCGGLATAWLLVTPKTWKAYQSLLVRDDLLGDNFKPGRFASQENQKNAQETILHIARKPQVIRAALQMLGPDPSSPSKGADGVDEQTIENVKEAISIVAPNGAEFGKTDVLVLSVKSQTRERAAQFADLLTGEIEQHLREVRKDQLQSMQDEVQLAVEQLDREYEIIAGKVKEIEQTFGSDLPVLRGLLDRSGSASDVQRALEQIRQERRAAENELEVARKQLELLKAIESDPSQFSVSSSELLNMQPIFKKLREGLTDAELRLLNESGRYEPGHPAVVHAREVIEQTREQIRREAQAVTQGLKSQAATAEEKLQRLLSSEQQYDQRLVRLANKRVEYEILSREMEKRGETLGKAKTELAQIQSLAEGSDRVNLITRIGQPQSDLRPEGMGKKAFVLLAIAGGLIAGGGLMGLFYQPDPQAPWNRGRRATNAAPTASGSFPNPPAAATLPVSAPTAHQAEPPRVAELARSSSRSPIFSSTRPSEQANPQDERLVHDDSPITYAAQWLVPVEALPVEQVEASWPTRDSSFVPAQLTEASVEVATTSKRLEPQSEKFLSVEEVVLPDHSNSAASANWTSEATAASAERPREPIDLDALKRALAEAAGKSSLASAELRSADDSDSAGKKAADSRTGLAAKPPSRQPSLTEQIDHLSQSISTYCNPVPCDYPPTSETAGS